jgi:membrane protein YdbS with pleckstrin-like domain
VIDREFVTKKDWWFVAIIWGAMIGVPLIVVAAAIAAGDATGIVISIAAAAIPFVILYGLAMPVRYTVTATEIVVRSGVLLRWHVPLAGIQAINPTHNPLSSPTWSLDRLHIDYEKANGRHTWIMISPEPRAAFMEVMLERVPGLRRNGDSIKR